MGPSCCSQPLKDFKEQNAMNKLYRWPLNNGFKLHESSYSWIFPNSKYYSITWSAVGWIWSCRTVDTEELQIRRADCKLYANFRHRCVDGQIPNPYVVQGSTVFIEEDFPHWLDLAPVENHLTIKVLLYFWTLNCILLIYNLSLCQ